MSDWGEVEVTATQLADGDWYGKADLTSLKPSTSYKVKVSSRNTEGYSQFSRIHIFTTPSSGNYASYGVVMYFCFSGPVKQRAMSYSSSAKMSVSSSPSFIILISSLISTHLFTN